MQNGAMSDQTLDFAHFEFGVRKINFFDKTSLARMLNDYEKFRDDSYSISIDKFTISSIRAKSWTPTTLIRLALALSLLNVPRLKLIILHVHIGS